MAYLGRHSLAQALIEKENTRQIYLQMDKSVWYDVDESKLSPEMKNSYLKLNFDQETSNFIEYSDQISNSLCLQLFYNIASVVLRLFYSRTCVNGLLNRGLMFLFSTSNLEQLLDSSGMIGHSVDNGRKAALDLGAGDGSVTEKFRKFYPHLYATEASSVMKRRLKQKNIIVMKDLDDWLQDSYNFDTIFCLNLIDRHPRPITMLKTLHEKMLNDDSTLILAVVFPFYQYVEYPERKLDGHVAIETIKIRGRTFEEQVSSFVHDILEPLNFVLVRWSRLPYLCEGDFREPFYVLDDAIFVLKAVNVQ